MVSRKVTDLAVQMFYLYHHLMMDGGTTHEETVDTVIRLTRLAEDYADQVITSLPEGDLEVLRNGLVGSYLAFLVDAVHPSMPAEVEEMSHG